MISRPRITAILEAGAALTVVRGACGTGKTVAVREWAESTDVDVVWLNADDGISSSDRLASALVARLARSELTRANRAGASSGWNAVRDILSELERPIALVVDNASRLQPDAIVDLCRVVAAKHGVRLIAAADRRTILDSEGAALVIDRSVIEPMELMFDDDEIQRALGVDSATAAKIKSATNGFPAVIHALAKRGIPAGGEPFLEAAVEAVEEYMRIRVTRSGYSPTLMRALMRVSIAESTDIQLARALSEDPNVERYLDAAESYGFGVWSSGRGDRVFRFAPFARILLRRELEREYPADLAQLRTLAAEWSLRAGAPLDALRLAVEDDDLTLARRIVTASWHRLITYEGRGVRQLLSPVPLSRLRQEPLLVMLLAICYNASRVRRLRGLQLFRIAVSAARSPGSDVSPTDRLFIWSAESSALRVLGMHERAGEVAVRALRVLADLSEDEREPYADELPLVCAQLGMSLYYGGHRRQAIDCFAYGAALADGAKRENALSNLSMLAGIHALDGDIPEARHYVELIRDGSWVAAQLEGYQGTFYQVAETVLALEEGDVERAAAHVAVFEPHRATSEHWVTMASMAAVVALCSGRPVAALTQLESFVELRGREAHSHSARRSLSRVRALANLAAGDARTAKTILQKDAGEDRFDTIVERARVALVEDRPGDTLRMLGHDKMTPTNSRLRAAASSLRTAALLRTAGPSAALREAQALGALLCDRGMRLPLAYLPPDDLRAVLALLVDAAPCELGEVRSALPDVRPLPKLTERETIVLRELMSTSSLAAIATELGVSPNTVKTQLRSVYRKLGVTGREEAVAVTVSRNLLSDDA